MSNTKSGLPISQTLEPTEPTEVAAHVREAYESDSAVYPIGGGTSLDYGLPAKRTGVGLSLAKLNRIIDYPARDMTITVESGATMAVLRDALAKEGQQLAIDVPRAAEATIGGVIATNSNGFRRYGMGSVRDHVIGISAVDGRGVLYRGGGRVVKNVAGYDFCKLLTGSLGTLGVITQVTLKLRPLAETRTLVVGVPHDLAHADRCLETLGKSATQPTAIELLFGEYWARSTELGQAISTWKPSQPCLVVALEGTDVEVRWMVHQLRKELANEGVENIVELTPATKLWSSLVEFPQCDDAPLTIRGTMVRSGVTRFVSAIRDIDPAARIQAHAASGSVLARFSEFPAAGLARTLVGRLQAVAANAHGHVTILSNPSGAETTHQAVWGGVDAHFDLMENVRRQFDPKKILNPGRFVYL